MKTLERENGFKQMFNVTLMVFALLFVSCAKELPIDVSEDIEQNVHNVSLFDSSVVVKTVGKEGAATLTASGEELNSQSNRKKVSLRKVVMVEGDPKLAEFVRDLELESTHVGEEFIISFKLNRNFLVAYIDTEGHSLSARRSALSEGTVAPLFQYNISSYGVLAHDENSLGEQTRTIVFKPKTQVEATHVQIPSKLENRNMLGYNINLVDKVFTQRKKHFDEEKLYLYVPMTMGTPREVTEAAPYYQGQEKLVKIKFKENGLEVFELDKDHRFRDNPLNNVPVLTIPGSYKDYSCEKDEYGKCLSVGEENTVMSWKKKKYFMPELEDIKVKEVNMLDLTNVNGDSCVIPTGQPELVDYVIKKGVINVELEKTYKLSDAWHCIANNYFRDTEGFSGLSTAGFKVRFFYSVVELDKIASKNYEAIDYPLPDHDQYGFFKNKVERLNDQFDSQRKDKKYLLNRWNPKKGKIVYHLSDTFNKAKNKIFKEKTYEVVKTINNTLKAANAGFIIDLKEPSGKKAGDLRNNMIVLIDDPLSNGLLGYAPTVTNPLTGEIVQGHVNMYSGVLTSIARRAYESMVDLSEQKEEEKVNEDKSEGPVKFSAKVDEEKIKKINRRFIGGKFPKYQLQAPNLHKHLSPGKISSVKKGMLNRLHTQKSKRRDDIEELTDFEKRAKIKMEKLEKYSEESAYSEEFFQISGTIKKLLPGISEIKGIKNADGTLKRWSKLNQKQRKLAANVIVPYAYTSTLVHEFGHNLGLRHNFIGSFDSDNYYTEEESTALGLKSRPAYSSIMDYAFSELNELTVFGKYDTAALRFAYAREVEVVGTESDKPKIVKIDKNITAFDDSLPEGQKRKEYSFCTDSNAGLSSSCNRFDEGSTLVEVAQHSVNKYNRYYKYRNFRDQKDNFQAEDLGGYFIARYREFNKLRDMYEEYEFFAGIFGDELMAQGCSPEMVKQYPICKLINERKDSIKIVGDFFINILKTPDHLCAVASTEKPDEVTELKTLSSLYDDVKYDIDHVTKTCFDPAIVSKLAEDKLVVKGEAGKFLNGFKGTDPEHPYSNDRATRGIWIDKYLAMKSLYQRKHGRSLTEKSHSALVDHPTILPQVGDFLSHITLGTKLENAHKFTAADGTKFEQNYSLDNSYMINGPQRSLSWLKRFIGLPSSGSVKLNKVLLQATRDWGLTQDDKYKDISRVIVNQTTVRRLDIQNSFDSRDIKFVTVDDVRYGASEGNVLAGEMLETMNSLGNISKISKEDVAKVVEARENPPIPAGLSEDETIAIKLEADLLNALISLAARGAELQEEFVITKFGEELGRKILTSYALGADTLQKVQELQEAMGKVPADASENVKYLYGLDMEIIKSYVSGTLEAKVKRFETILPILPNNVRSF